MRIDMGWQTLEPAQTLDAYVERLFPEAVELFQGDVPEGEAGELVRALREAGRLAFALRDSGPDLYRLRPAVRVVERLVTAGR